MSKNEIKNLSNNGKDSHLLYFNTPEELLLKIDDVVIPTQVVADIGCGIMPINYFKPTLHMMIEPWGEYADILESRYIDDPSVVVIRSYAIDSLKLLGDNSVDSVFLLDVIEHMEKEDGLEVIKQCERVARVQIVLFTPLGFMSQELEVGEKDGWGLSGTVVQTHKSGWLPEDFGQGWSFYISEDFHKVDHRNEPLDKPHGAFYAVKNFSDANSYSSKKDSFAKRMTKEEVAQLQRIKELEEQSHCIENSYNLINEKYIALQAEYSNLMNNYTNLQAEHQKITHSYQSILALTNEKVVRQAISLKKLIRKLYSKINF